MYKLNILDVSSGIIANSTEQISRLNAEECLLIGSALFKNHRYGLAAEWMQVSQQRFAEEGLTDSSVVTTTQAVIEIAVQHARKNATVNAVRQLTTAYHEELCRNADAKGVLSSYLRCYHETYGNPFLLLQPLEMEIISTKPSVIFIHRFLRDDQADQLVEIGRENVRRPKSTYGATNRTNTAKRRLAKSAALRANTSSFIQQIDRWSAMATDLNSQYAESLQIKNYPVGGALQLHFDVLQQGPLNFTAPDRMATLLVYLNDVEHGGATIFPLLDLTVPAVKNGAVLWYNQYKDGIPDGRTLHAGCPVLLGTKWVTIKWLHNIGHWRQRPCGLQEDSKNGLTVSQVHDLFKPSG
ncbi:prolyl 4-hydroxylase subunit alpha-3-like [Paramacrobiotus metropolitanus]|uniref:prolyl 4-hydroxylase subunit alpha-3-like n=1 Tax=Paramacrobiotus metropolitanus TaxID=2943436 RepID=UPI002445828A|nr:prolyl 4-hydroxylase subunit alpha-3-like [Paramacrobiotus metropolitanus]